MVQYQDAILDRVFAALADPTRRHVLEALGRGSLAVSELAAPHGMSLPGFMKHLRVLEDAGLIARNKAGRVVSCELSAAPMREAATWMLRYERFWTEKLDALARYLGQQAGVQSRTQPGSPKSARSPSSVSPRPRRKKSASKAINRRSDR